MPSPAGIIAKLDSVLNRFAPPDRTVFLRTVTITGGDPLIHQVGSISTSDTIFSPQPMYHRIGREHVPGGHAKWEVVDDANGELVLADDWMFIFSPDAITLAQIYSPNSQIVMKDTSGNTEILTISDPDVVGFQGTDVMYTVYTHSARRP